MLNSDDNGPQTETIAKIARVGIASQRISLLMTYSSIAIISVLAVTLLVLLLRAPVAPIEFTRISYDPRLVCAGDTVSYTVQVRIMTAPSVLTGAEAWWSIDQQITALPGDRLLSAVYTEPVNVTRMTSITVPAQFAPGRYEYRRAWYYAGAPASIFIVPFTVTEDGCK